MALGLRGAASVVLSDLGWAIALKRQGIAGFAGQRVKRLIDRLERQPFFESRCAQLARVAQYSQARQVSGEYGL